MVQRLPTVQGKSVNSLKALSDCRKFQSILPFLVGKRQGIALEGVRAIEGWKAAARTGESAAKTSVRTPGLSTDHCEHPFV